MDRDVKQLYAYTECYGFLGDHARLSKWLSSPAIGPIRDISLIRASSYWTRHKPEMPELALDRRNRRTRIRNSNTVLSPWTPDFLHFYFLHNPKRKINYLNFQERFTYKTQWKVKFKESISQIIVQAGIVLFLKSYHIFGKCLSFQHVFFLTHSHNTHSQKYSL